MERPNRTFGPNDYTRSVSSPPEPYVHLSMHTALHLKGSQVKYPSIGQSLCSFLPVVFCPVLSYTALEYSVPIVLFP